MTTRKSLYAGRLIARLPLLSQPRQNNKIQLLLVILLALAGFSQTTAAQSTSSKNSTKKIRVTPTPQATLVGSAVQWETDYAAALKKSKSTNKPIFWYVPSVSNTFMDRQPEIDRYMLAGPFSWPSIISLLNQKFVPLRCLPEQNESERFQIEVYRFVEPGFLIISAEEQLLLSADRLTTLHPHWFFHQISKTVSASGGWQDYAGYAEEAAIAQSWEDVQRLNWRLSPEALNELLQSGHVELELLAGMVQFYSGEHAAAKATWAATASRYPEHPLGWKAACEAQGIGPFVRGFETFDVIPGQLLESSENQRLTSGCNLVIYGDSDLWSRGTNFLLRMQEQQGGFFDSDYDFGGTDSLPNVHVAVTSLAGMALIRAHARETDQELKQRIESAISRAAGFVANEQNLNLDDRDEILWAQAYRVCFLAELEGNTELKSGNPSALQQAVLGLESIQMSSGSWYHEYANAFVTATALTALAHAQRAGAEVDSEKVNRGLKRLESQRLDNGAYPYATRTPGQNDAGTANDLAASGGRISVCELARRRWGQVDESDFERAIEISLHHHQLMAKALKYDDHTSTMAYGGFFFWYNMHGRSEAISLVTDPSIKQRLAAQQLELIRALPELDGCFVDSHELGRCYGTAMALISLSLLQE